MAKPLTRTAAFQNRAFLKALRRSGNVRLAAREVGLAHSTLLTRRRRHPHFALAWDAALVVAQARLAKKGKGPLHRKRSPRNLLEKSGGPGPSTIHSSVNGPPPRASSGRSEGGGSRLRTSGGEPVIVRLASGKLQVRRAIKGRLTPAAEQAFLAALSATCNVTLSAAAVGAAPRAFYRRKRMDLAFAREMRLALQRGSQRLELALLESGLAGSREHDDWRDNDPPAMPPMTVPQALQLLYLHQKEARLIADPWPVKRRRGESREAHCVRLAAVYEARQQRARDEFDMAEAERWARGEPAWGPAGEAVRRELGLSEDGPSIRACDATQDGPSIRRCAATQDERSGWGLPDLAQVTGWSRADPDKVPHDPERALFAGWRMEEMEEKMDEGRWLSGARVSRASTPPPSFFGDGPPPRSGEERRWIPDQVRDDERVI